MAKKELKVTKSNELTQANFSEFSLSSYRVFEHILAKLQHYDCNKNLIHLSLAQRECSLSASEYAKEFGIGRCNVYALLKSAVDQLMKTSYSMKFDNRILKINVCSQAEYCSETGTIDIRFTEEIMPHIAGLAQKFTMYKLNDISGLNSIYSTRLYELLMQWKTKGELKISIKDLRFTLGCTDKFKLYGLFKQYAFGHAVEEINSKFEINLSYKEIKTGRAVTEVIFKFKAIQTQEFYDIFLQRKRTKVKSFKKKINLDSVTQIHPDQQDLAVVPI
jgi:plasmid replication initiation protein